MAKLFKNKAFRWLIVVAAAVIAFYYFSAPKEQASDYTTVKAESGSLTRTVSATGSVEPLTAIDLSFKNRGKIRKKYVEVGDEVKTRDIIMEQTSDQLAIKVRQASADLEAARAELKKLKEGGRDEDIKIQEEKAHKAEVDYNNALLALEDKKQALENTKNIENQKVKNYEDSLVSRLNDDIDKMRVALAVVDDVLTNDDTQSTLSAKSPSHLSAAQLGYSSALAQVNGAKVNVDIISGADNRENQINTALSSVETALNAVQDNLYATYQVLIYTITSSALSAAELDTLKSNITTEQTTINTAIANTNSNKHTLLNGKLSRTSIIDAAEAAVNTATASVNSAQAALGLAKAELEEIKAPASPSSIDAGRAKVRQYEAALDWARRNLDDTILRSPIDGIVTQINFDEGEQDSINKPAVKILGKGNFEIKVDIAEADIAQIFENQATDITFDAFSEEEHFKGVVSMVDPAETIISDVVYYKVTIVLLNSDNAKNENYQKIKSGMTANIDIKTAEKDNVIIIPQRAVIEKNGSKIVRVLVSGMVEEKEVITGIRGDGGMIEIISGIEEGDEAVTYVKESK